MPVRLIAAPHTPLDERGRLNLRAVRIQAEHFAATNVAGVFICGSTGEGVSLTVEERMHMVEAWQTAAKAQGLQWIVHCGHNSAAEAARLASHAAALGADGVAVMAPSFFKPSSVDDLLRYLVPIAAVCEETAFYYYDIPSLTGVALPTPEVFVAARSEIANFAGIKFTKNDLVQYQECVHLAGDEKEVLFGCDEMLLAAYVLGARGAVGSSYNFAAGLYHRMIAAFDAGDFQEARKLQYHSVQIIRTCERYGYLSAAKSLMQLHGIDCGPVRPPLRELTEQQKLELHEAVQRLGLAGP